MSYRLFPGGKRRRRKKIKFNKYTFQAIILTFIALFAYRVSDSGGIAAIMETGLFSATKEVTSDLEVHFIDVGQGDSVLLTCDGEAMLIDAGTNSMGDKVTDYIQYLGIDRLEYVVATHPDADHIGGIDTVLKSIECDMVIMTDEKKDTMTYQEVEDIIEEKNIERHSPKVQESFDLGCSTVTVLGPVELGEDSNNNSIVLLVTHGNEKFLFSGDAETEEMEEICSEGMSFKANVYKASHHGSSTGVDEKFLSRVSPEFAVISCGEDNSYGHPHAELLNYLRSNNIAVFRTDEQGTIVAVSDGDSITWNCSPSESWQSGDK